ncbi:AAA domain-containing protein [Cyathus striatus]|nr:AAA domain-containing protein [Cyathus striatus]
MASYPPLLGDKDGHYRVRIVGNSGTGKSTTASALAKILGVPYLSLDTFFWQPGWKETPADEMQAKFSAALDACKNGWVVDGNYERRIGPILQASVTDIIWLDPPLALYLPRIILRTVLGILRLEPPCSPGCPETFSKAFFSKDSIIWWCITDHGLVRRRNTEKMKIVGLGVGSDTSRQIMRRIGGWGSTLRRWMQDVTDMIATKRTKTD